MLTGKRDETGENPETGARHLACFAREVHSRAPGAREEALAWFIGQSIIIIALAVVLGLVIGWLWWRRRKVQFDESQAITRIVAGKDAEIAERDEEIARLRTSAVPARRADPVTPPAAPPEPVMDVTAGLPLVPTDPAPDEYAAQATPVEDIPTGGIPVGTAGSRALSDVRALADAQAAADAAALADAAAIADAEAARHASDRSRQAAPSGGTRVGTASEVPSTPSPSSPAGTAQDVVDVAAAEAAGVVDVTGGAGDGTDGVEPAEGDDLERVEGIGPRIGAALRNAGIHTFGDLAGADTATLQSALEQAGLRFAPSLPTWSRQARLLADGDEAGFQALTQQLMGGRDISKAK
jgi:predicted flap endonuclease-1-like 5' DNA nuclease/cbb3-type cytochrome oxidase subunit 3